MLPIRFILACALTLLTACSESSVNNNVKESTATDPEPKADSSKFGCGMISLDNPAKAALDDPDLRFDVDFPKAFEIRKLAENDVAIGYVAGVRVNPKSSMVSFGYQFTQSKAAQTVPQVMLDVYEKQGFEKEAVVSWQGKLLDVYAQRTDTNQVDMKVWLPADAAGQFYAVSAKVFLQAKEECTAEISKAMTLFISTMRPKEV